MKMKIKSVSGKTFTKNQRLFQKLCVVYPERFLSRLMEIRQILGLPKIKVIHSALEVLGDNPSSKEWDELTKLISTCTENRNQFFLHTNDDALKDFYELISHILDDNKLGEEWRFPLIDVVLNGFFIPPINNLGIESNLKEKSLRIRLNPSTSIEDIKDVWDLVEKAKKDIFPRANKRNITKKSVEHLIDYAKAKDIQSKYPELKGTGLIAELYQVSDDEELPDSATDKKTANNLRQIKSRLKRSL
jgi:hypothetical protein